MNFTYKQIWLINFPVMMSILVEQLINITDAIFLGHVGEVELGASAIASIYYLAVYMLGFGFGIGLQVMIARRNGEKNYESTGRVFFQGLYFLALLAVFLFILSKALSPLLLHRLISSGEVYDAVMKYIDWRCFGLLFAFPALAFRAFFVGTTNTKMLTLNALAMVSVNILFNYLLIFGKGGFPALGITGAAMASSLSELVSLLIFLIYIACMSNRQRYGIRPAFDWQLLRQLLRLSVWSMLQSFISVAPWFLFFVTIEHLGKSQLAIANIVRSISTLFFVIVNSFATTTGSLISNLIGAEQSDYIHMVCRKVLKSGYLSGVPIILLAAVFHNQAIGIYTEDVALTEAAFPTFMVMLGNYFMALPAYIYCNAVTGTGNTRAAFLFQCITIVFYLLYLWMISNFEDVSLTMYWLAEYIFVILLFVFSYGFMRWKYF
ncbi:MATE family efflux transporter [Prevotella sp. 10(H)]|uniref:MATE family efflux transporter n=1 Tax=Prevotella sp. 10(H) TaxID=1158294 RepID=UPI0004A6F08C|nr:MATE family efflux transporter [Prevotella sp. 10(H)]